MPLRSSRVPIAHPPLVPSASGCVTRPAGASLPMALAPCGCQLAPGLYLVELVTHPHAREIGVIRGLDTQPVAIAGPEEPAESEVRVRSHGALARHDLADARRQYADFLRQSDFVMPIGSRNSSSSSSPGATGSIASSILPHLPFSGNPLSLRLSGPHRSTRSRCGIGR